jgi:cytochrome P450
LPLKDAQPPGPRAYPFFGNTFLARRDPLGTLARWAREYGDVIHYQFFGLPMYILVHPHDIEQVLLAKSNSFVKGITARANPELFGNGLLTSDGEFWRRQRRLANPAFHRESINRYAEITIEEAGRLLSRWEDGETRDIHQDMMNVTLKIVLRSLFGIELEQRGRIIERALDVIMRISAGVQAVISFLRIPTPMRRRYFRAVRELDGVVYELIAIGRERLKHDSAAGSVQKDLLTMLLLARDDDGNAMTDQQLRDEVITLLLAGHETTALNLSWTWYLLATNPDIEEQFHGELDRVVSGNSPQLADLARLPFTDRVLREALRLYPPAWRIWRTAAEPFKVGEFVLPAGSNVVMSQWLTQRDSRWFPDPERFDPNRWTEDFAAKLPRFAYFPFGGGPRVCIGAGFATMEATLLLAAIAQRFRLRVLENQCVEPMVSITFRPKNGIKVELQQRRAVESSALRVATSL